MIARLTRKHVPPTTGRPTLRLSLHIALLAATLCALAACKSGSASPQNGSTKETGQELFGKGAGPGRTTPKGPANTSWSIMTGAYSGPDQTREANSSVAILQSLGFLDAFAEQRGKVTIVAMGHYPEPGDPRAQEDLARIRDFTVSGD